MRPQLHSTSVGTSPVLAIKRLEIFLMAFRHSLIVGGDSSSTGISEFITPQMVRINR